MTKTLAHYSVTAALLALALPVASPAMAEAVACGIYKPGLIAYLTGVRPAPCAYQGDYIAKQGPTYDGPAVVAPQPTYSPSRTVAGYIPARSWVESERGVRRTTVTRVKRVASRSKATGKGKVQIVHARAEVRIYGPDRMEIFLHRR
jgi:hypothetical protein